MEKFFPEGRRLGLFRLIYATLILIICSFLAYRQLFQYKQFKEQEGKITDWQQSPFFRKASFGLSGERNLEKKKNASKSLCGIDEKSPSKKISNHRTIACSWI